MCRRQGAVKAGLMLLVAVADATSSCSRRVMMMGSMEGGGGSWMLCLLAVCGVWCGIGRDGG